MPDTVLTVKATSAHSSDRAFATVLGLKRGRTFMVVPPQVQQVQQLIDAGQLTQAATLIRTHTIRHFQLLRNLSRGLALEALEIRWGDRTRTLLDMCTVIRRESRHLISDRQTGLVHIWPEGHEHTSPYLFIPDSARTATSIKTRANLE